MNVNNIVSQSVLQSCISLARKVTDLQLRFLCPFLPEPAETSGLDAVLGLLVRLRPASERHILAVVPAVATGEELVLGRRGLLLVPDNGRRAGSERRRGTFE